MRRNDMSARGTEVDMRFLDALLGCHFVSRNAAEHHLAELRSPVGEHIARNQRVRAQEATAHVGVLGRSDASEAASLAALNGHVLPDLAEASLLPLG
mmetsp:Transcript_18252/g.45135  ORF Transcript_18252/g.45135 Transcript_18252/m.45135 type:complete len:97 (-) Transcript_18252:260-550(-)